MATQTHKWKDAFKSFIDRRAVIMLFLGFSAGIPILLIFSSLSLWLGEAGIEKSAVTFFSWAALGYSFKFVWAPLIDELPVPFLTRALGRRRAWLLIAQILIVFSICIMAFSDPSLGQSYLIQMAVGAVLLGFSAATQDIVIDAYRIELAETQMQTVLASTYNAGYRIGMIVAGAGALFLAAYLGTSKGNYIYEAWKQTYLAMAGVMLVGIVTTLLIREPKVDRIYKAYQRSDYFRLVLVFFIAVVTFVLSYIYIGQLMAVMAQVTAIHDNAALFGLEVLRFLTSAASALFIGFVLVRLGVVNKEMATETWIAPVLDFFKRYGVKLALMLLLLIGFYRISDIIAGVISNVFYQDLNFSKEQIAEAVKIYGVIFSLLGGFLGGLLAQRMNIMKLMFVGAVLASATNLIFINLVKSGQPLSDVQIQVGENTYTAQVDEVGYFSVQVPNNVLLKNNQILVETQFKNQPSHPISVALPYLKEAAQPKIQLLPITSDDELSSDELTQNIVVRGQFIADSSIQTDKDQSIVLTLDGMSINAKLDSHGLFSAIVDSSSLRQSPTKIITVEARSSQGEILAEDQRTYQLSTASSRNLDVSLDPIAPIKSDLNAITEVKGKVLKSYSFGWLYAAIILDNLASGLAGAAFIAFLSSLTSVSFTAVQYAIFSSLMTLTPKLLGGYSGTIVTHIGYPKFFLMTTLIGLPVLILVVLVARLLKRHEQLSKP